MTTHKNNYSNMELGSFSALSEQGRVMIGKELALTGCEISANSLPAGQSIPFVHTHKQNEEVYIILRGSGQFMVDQDEFPIQEGSVIRVAPAGERTLTTGSEELQYLCIQTQQGSLQQSTETDGVMCDTKASWM